MVKAQGFVICCAASKGGVGKSTLAASLAVRASEDSERVALLDLDPQHSLSRWWELRGRPSNPKLFTGVESLTDDIALLKGRGWEWIIIDTPGQGYEHILEPAILAADFVLVPVRASGLDVEAVTALADLCRRRRKVWAFVLNDYEPKWKISTTAAEYLGDFGHVLKDPIHHSQAHLAAMGAGKVGAEYPSKPLAAAAADDINKLWLAILKRTRTAKR